MSRDLRSVLDVAATVEEVWDLRTAERWVELKATTFRDGSTLLERSDDGGAVTLVVARNLPDGAPGFLQRFLPRDGKVVQRETWARPGADGVSTGTWTVEIPGAPARLGGTCRFEPFADGTRQTVLGAASIAIPLVGGKAEQYVVDMSTRLIEREGQLMREALQR